MKFLLTLVFLVACTAPCRDVPHWTSSGLFLYCNCLNPKHPLNVDIVPVESGHDTNASSAGTVTRFQSKTFSEDEGKWKQQKHVKWYLKKKKKCYQLSETCKSWSRWGGYSGRIRFGATGCCRWLVCLLASSLGSWVWQVCVPTNTEWVSFKVIHRRCWMKAIWFHVLADTQLVGTCNRFKYMLRNSQASNKMCVDDRLL